MACMHIAPDNPVIELRHSRHALHTNQLRTAMNAKTFARIVLVSAAALAAASGAEAKGSMSVGLTIVSSCAVSGASLYQTVSSKTPSGKAANGTMTAVCANDTSYSVSLSPVVKLEGAAGSSDELQAGLHADSSRARPDAGDAGYVVVTLTY